MSTDKDFFNLPRDMQQYLIELQLKERIRDLHAQFWNQMGELSKRELDLFRQAYLIGLADGLEELSSDVRNDSWVIMQLEPEKRKLIINQTLHAVLVEYQALDHTLDRLIGLIGRMFQDQDEQHVKLYRNRLNDILYELELKISDHRKGDTE